MSLGPFQSEQVHAPDFEKLVANVCLRPAMWVNPVSYGAVCSFFGGFDTARSGGPLMGLQPWLVLRANDYNNFLWAGIAFELISREPADDEESADQRAITGLGQLLSEFFDYRRSQGLTKIFTDYADWLLHQDWYTGPLLAN